MATKKKSSRAKSRSSGTRRATVKPSAAGRELKALRGRIKQLAARLEREMKSRKLDAKVIAEARKARAQVSAQIQALKTQGLKLASQLKAALGSADKREQARKDALAKIAGLRAELTQKTEELARKSGELKRLALESAERAREIIRGEPEAPSTPQERPSAPVRSGPEGSGTPET